MTEQNEQAEPAEPAVEFHSVSKSFTPGQKALSSVSFRVEQGETLVLLGSSGSGKTTCLKMINRLVDPDEGKVMVQGRETADWDPIQLRRRAGYVIQEVGLLPHLNVEENVALVPRLEGWEPDKRRARAHELLSLVGLEPDEFSTKRPSQLSGGQKQRVGVARALAVDPPLLLMDEPFGALDPITRRRLQKEFRELEERLGKTVVFVTHDVQEALRLADRIAVMDQGQIKQIGPPQEIVEQPADEFVREAPSVAMDFLGFLVERRSELATMTAQHIFLVLVATGLAVAVGVPLGLLLTRRPRLARPVMGLASVMQTVPSLALFGLLIPIPLFGGIGARTAIVALVLYALLPILRNTYTGVLSVDPAVIEAGRGMGMTDWQRLRIVEIPLALPTILAGVRIATVVSVGLATIAAAIGAGGLGDYIFRGLSTVDNWLILAGAIPAALLAIIADGFARMVGKSHGEKPLRVACAAFALLLVTFVAGVTGVACERSAVVVGSKNFSEQVILGEIVALLLEERGLAVDRRLNLGGSFICHSAMESGQMDVYIEYTGTALTAILKEPVLHDPEEVYRKVQEEYRERYGLAWGLPLGFDNTYAMAMRSEHAKSLGLSRISDLAAHVKTIRTGFGHEFLERQDGYPGFTRAYGLDFAIPPRGMELGLIYQALVEEKVDLIAGSSTDGLIERFGLTVLEDDRRFFPPYDAAPVYRPETAEAHPAFREVIQMLGGAIDEPAMRSMNRAVDNDRRRASDVAKEFLVDKGWISLTGDGAPPYP